MKKLLMVVYLVSNVALLFSQESIFDAARNNDTASINSILKDNKEAINFKNEFGHTPLILAAYNNNLICVEYLIRKGADVNYMFSQGSALHGAAYKGLFEIVELLIEKGAEVDLADQNGSTPLMYATLFKHNKTAKLLYTKGADKNKKDNTGSSALDYAQSLQNTELLLLFKNN